MCSTPEETEVYLDKEKNININKFFYRQIGKDHFWRDRLLWSDKEWSKYVDNINLDMYTDSKEGLTPRKKIRLRTYPKEEDKKIYLEVKNSSVEGRFKTREILDKNEFNQKKTSGILDNQYGLCFPKLYVSYKREYSIINDVRISTDPSNSFFSVDSGEAIWNKGSDERPNLGYHVRNKGGYFPCPPHDTMQDVRSEMVNHMVSIGMNVEAQHHEVATAGQQEIDLRFDTLLSHADDLQKYKYVVRNTAKSNGLSATFMPKPLSNDNGSGMHCHQSIWSNGKPIFYADSGYANLSDEAKFYIGGLLKHAPSLLAFTNPTINSFKRLVPGYEAPVKLAYSNRNRSAICRIPAYSPSPKAKRVEFRCPDATANPYLAFAAMVMAGLDGIKNRIDPGEPMDKNLYDLPAEEQAKVKEVPASLEEAINNLQANHDYLLDGNVFTKDLIESYIEYKREEEIEPNKLVVTPKEYDLYYDY